MVNEETSPTVRPRPSWRTLGPILTLILTLLACSGGGGGGDPPDTGDAGDGGGHTAAIGTLILDVSSATDGVSGTYAFDGLVVSFTATLDAESGEALAVFSLDVAAQSVEVDLLSETEGAMRWRGQTYSGIGPIDAEQSAALAELTASPLGWALGEIPLELGCLIDDPDTAAQRAALVLPLQMLIKYEASTPDIFLFEASSSCRYFPELGPDGEEEGRPALLSATPGLILGLEDQVPHVYGFFPFDEEGAVDRAVNKDHRGGAEICNAACRGTCGIDCPENNCNRSTVDYYCETDPYGRRTGTLVYLELIDCGTHQACRDHDGCYDDCHIRLGCGTWAAALCRRGCDAACANEFTWRCPLWAAGMGPLDETRLTYRHEWPDREDRERCPLCGDDQVTGEEQCEAAADCEQTIGPCLNTEGRPGTWTCDDECACNCEDQACGDGLVSGSEACEASADCEASLGPCINPDGDQQPWVCDECACECPRDFQPPCRGGCSTGDPHLVTLDGLLYDLQSYGELVLIEPADDGVDGPVVQARQLPAVSARCPQVTYNAAVAAQIGDHRLTIQTEREVPLRIDGEPVRVQPGQWLELEGGGFVYGRGSASWRLGWPDGSLLWVRGSEWLDLDLDLADDWAGRVQGLFGDADGDPDNDLRLPGGVVMTRPVAWDDLYGRFAAAYRVDPEASLFDYEAEEAPEDFWDPGFPALPARAAHLPEADRIEAEEACDAAGVEDPGLFEACVLDVACSGNSGDAAWLAGLEAPEAVLATSDPNAVGGGGVRPSPTPPDLSPGAFEADDVVYLLHERSAVTLATALDVDVSTPGRVERDAERTPDTIPAETVVDSFLLHLDSIGDGAATVGGTAWFAGEILGIGLIPAALDAGDSVVGGAGVSYPVDDLTRGLELEDDWIVFNDDRHSLEVHLSVDAELDQLRVVTRAPEVEDASFVFADFENPFTLSLHNSATATGGRLRLTPSQSWKQGSAWYLRPVTIADGFETTFVFEISELSGGGADGFAFVIEGGATGLDPTGGAAGDIGYAGIANSLAIEFDTYTNSSDPNANHISVQTRGLEPNSVNHADSLGATTDIPDMSDTAAGGYLVHVVYTPPSGGGGSGGLEIGFDGNEAPVLSVEVDLGTLLDLLDGRGAYVGFTASTGASWENHDILSWSFASEGAL